MSSCLYFGQVMHEREQPVAYKFVYDTVSIKVDIDQIEQETKQNPLLSLNRFNWVSLRFKDHGPRDGTPWRTWVDGFLADYGIARPARVELLCYPRILGYSFNPLAVWYAYDAQNRVMAVIAEVSNTFGQWHHYILKPKDGLAPTSIKAEADKVFHVSPFIDMQARYHFRLKRPGDQVFTYIKETRDGKPFFYASQSGRQQPLNISTLLKLLGFAPWRALKVISLIHWWALKIWLKGGQFHRTPKHLESVNYSHSEMKLC
jgi:DUF1365 family protein